MFSATISKSFPITGSYKVVIDEVESDEEFDALPVLPFKGTDGSSAVRYVYEVGTKVLVTQINSGQYCILGCIPTSTERADTGGRVRLPGSKQTISKNSTDASKLVGTSLHSKSGEANFTGFEEQDLIPGDLSLTAGGGASVKVLRGGLASLGSDTAQVTSNKADSSVVVDSIRYTNRTAMGEFSITDDPSGNFSMEFQGNADPAATNPNILFSVTSNGDSPSLSLTLGDFGVSISSTGDITLRGSRLLFDNGSTILDVVNRTTAVESKLQVDSGFEDILLSTKGNTSSKTMGNSSVTVGGEVHDTAGDYRSITTTGPSVTKNPLLTLTPDSVITRADNILSGSHKISIGTSTNGGGSFHVDSHGGDIKLASKDASTPLIGGSVTLSSTSSMTRSAGPYGIVLDSSKLVLGGGYGLPEPGSPSTQAFIPPIAGGFSPSMSGACKFNALYTYLKVLHGLLDSHVHPVPPLAIPPLKVKAGATLPGATSPGTAAPAPIFSGPLTTLALSIESQSTWLTGV